MKKLISTLFKLSLLTGLSGCSLFNSDLDIEEVPQWINDSENGWTSTYKCNQVEMISQSIPSELKTWNLTGNKVNSDFENLLLQNKTIEYFTFTIRNDQFSPLQLISTSQNEYFEIQDYIENDMRYEFYLITDKDTLFPSLYHVERYYNYIPEIKINLAFEKGKDTFQKLVFENSVFECPFIEFNTNRTPLPKINFN